VHLSKTMAQQDWRSWLLPFYLCGAMFLAYMARQSLFSIFPILRKQLFFSEVQLGLTGTVFLWTYALANPITGYLGDRFSKKNLIVAGIILWSGCTFMIGTTQSASGLLVWRGALALTQALYLPAAVALIVQVHSENSRSKALSVHGAGQFIGIIVGGWYGGFAAEWLGWRSMLWILALVTAMYGVALAFIVNEKGDTASPRLDRSQSASKPAAQLPNTLLTPTYMSYCFSFFSICAILWVIYTWLPDIVKTKFNLSLADAGLVATLYVQVPMIVAIFGGAFLGDRLMKRDKRSRLFIMISGLTLSCPFIYFIARAETLEQLKLAALGYGFFKGVFSSNFLASLSDILPVDRRGFGIGFCNSIGALAAGLSAYLFGLLKTQFSIETLFGFAGVLGLVATSLLMITLWLFFLRDYEQVHPKLNQALPSPG